MRAWAGPFFRWFPLSQLSRFFRLFKQEPINAGPGVDVRLPLAPQGTFIDRVRPEARQFRLDSG